MDSEELATKAREVAWQFARSCREVEEHTPATEQSSLGWAINYLMSELWDNGFSTEEIQRAFTSASIDVVRYAGPEPRNGTGIRGAALLGNGE